MQNKFGPDIDHDTATFWHREHSEPVKKWEYCMASWDNPACVKNCDDLGSQGWELVAVAGLTPYAYFKRELKESK